MGVKTDNMVFVFGSNLGGIHGAGAAAFAANKRGACWGVGIGPRGQSYAIPTKGIKDGRIGDTLPLETIKIFVDEFIDYAASNPDTHFQVTCIGCGLAGLQHKDVAPLFRDAPGNCWFDEEWEHLLGGLSHRFWGTF